MLLWCLMAEPRDSATNQEQQRLLALESYILRMAQSDKEALACLYEETKAAVYGFVLSTLKNPSDAEDVLQETYLRLYHAAGRYECNGNPMPWILTVARNLALMKLRERQRQGWVSEEQLDQLEWGAASYAPGGMTVEDRMILEAAIATLSTEECQIVMLHAVAGCKHREIAKMLQLPLSTVLSKYRRALKKLKRQWEEKEQYEA